MVKADDFDEVPQAGQARVYSIAFRPKPDVFKKNIDPGFLLNVLRSMGKLDLVADTSGIPPLSDLEHDGFHMSWSGTLETTSPAAEIESIFAPVAADCEFTLTDLTPGAAAGTSAGDEAAPVAPPPLPQHPHRPPLPPRQPRPPRHRRLNRKQPRRLKPRPGNGKEPRGAAAKQASSVTIRVELEKIDRVVNMVGELVIAQAMLHQVIDELPEHTSARVTNILSDLVRHTRGLKDSVDGDPRPAGELGVPAHAAPGARAVRQDRQEGSDRDGR